MEIKRGVLTGLNEAFILDGKTKDRLIAQDPRSAEIIRPLLRGRDIKRGGYTFADKWLIAIPFGSYKTLPHAYPAIYQHLLPYEEQLKKRGQCKPNAWGKQRNADYPGQHHWLELDNNPSKEYLSLFDKPKIVWGEISDKPKFAFDKTDHFTPEATAFLMTGNERLDYVCVYLNSSLAEYLFSLQGTTTGVGTVRWKKYKLEQLALPRPTEDICALLSGHDGPLEQISPQVMSYVYALLHFSQEEIDFIDQHGPL